MTPRPARIAQTSTEAKRQHKRNGFVLPERQQRQLERAAELEQRAARLREKEQRKQAAKKKRKERERKERETRQQMGVGLATQLIGYSCTQAQLKCGMEAFLGLTKKRNEDKMRDLEIAKKLEALAEAEQVPKEPWDDEDADDTLLELPEADRQWMDDGLDDDALLEAHDLFMSDPVEELVQDEGQRPPIASARPPEKEENSAPKEDPAFVRLHGPVNKTIENVLNGLPKPLIELLSQDTSTDTTIWKPANSLLHKLNPVGLPPHRLRLKVGCTVILLRDLNTSSQLSKSQHLQILRAEKDRLECLVLDGQLKGTKTFLTRVPFFARHHNDDKYPFQRVQFPIKVSSNVSAPRNSREGPISTFKLPSMSGLAPRSTSALQKAVLPIPRSGLATNPNPSFKLPGIPAPKSQPTATPKPLPVLPTISLLDGWDDFLDSATQIARELSCEGPPVHNPSFSALSGQELWPSYTSPPLSTQDLDFSLEDLCNSPKSNAVETEPVRMDLPAQPPPSNNKQTPSRKAAPVELSTKTQAFPTSKNSSSFKPSMPPPRKPPSGRPILPLDPSVAPPSCHGPGKPGLKRKSLPISATNTSCPHKRVALQTPPSAATPNFSGSVAAFASFGDFGLSTQEATSFFDDDDDLTFGSPPIAV